jgi:hypothetical protein
MQSVWGSKLIMAQTRPHKQTGPYHHHHQHPLIISCSPVQTLHLLTHCSLHCLLLRLRVGFHAALGDAGNFKEAAAHGAHRLLLLLVLAAVTAPHAPSAGGRRGRDDIDRRRSLPRLTIRRRHPHPHPTPAGPDRHNAFPLSFSHSCLFVTNYSVLAVVKC